MFLGVTGRCREALPDASVFMGVIMGVTDGSACATWHIFRDLYAQGG